MSKDNVFKNVLLLSDIDGTLNNKQHEIPPINLKAIKRFMDLGGSFAIASGRGPESIWSIARETKANSPCVTLNGAMLYNFELNVPIYSWTLPDSYKEIILLLREDFPTLGIQTYVGSHIYNVWENDVVNNLFVIENLDKKPLKHYEKLNGNLIIPSRPINKILLGQQRPLLEKVSNAFETQRYKQYMDGIRYAFTWEKYLELLPKDADKGKGALMLAKQLYIPKNRIAVIGDYFNDVEMLKVASLSMVAGNAPQEIKQMADFISCHCDDGAVAVAIEHMEKLILKGLW